MANNSIALLAKPVVFDTPAETEAKNLQLGALRDAAAQRAQAAADDAAVRDVYKNNSDPAGRIKALYTVSPKAGAAAEKSMVDLDKDRAEIGKTQAATKMSQIDVARKKIDAIGQTLGYVMKNPSADSARRAVDSLKEHGFLTSDEAASYHSQIDANPDPEHIKSLATESYSAALDAKDQLAKIETRDLGGTVQSVSTDPVSGKQTVLGTLTKTQTPDSVASNARMREEGRLNRDNQIKVQTMIADRQPTGTKLGPEDVVTMAEQYLAGDKSVLQGLGRGAQGAEDIRAVRAEIGKQVRARGGNGADVAAKIAEYGGLVTGLRATGNISARVENAAEEAAQLAPLALAASEKVARSGLLPFGKAQIMFDTQTNDPDLARFATANMGLVTAYASAMARGGKATVSDMDHARSLLTEAGDQPSYRAKVNQMLQEIEAAKRAPRVVRDSLTGEISGKGGHGSPKTTVRATPNTNAQGWVLHTDANGNKAYVSPDGKQFQEVK